MCLHKFLPIQEETIFKNMLAVIAPRQSHFVIYRFICRIFVLCLLCKNFSFEASILSNKADLDRKYHRRVLKFLVIYIAFIGLSLLVGILGYRLTENYAWIDCLLNTAMLMGGMGQINPLQTDAGKGFASVFAIYCGTFELLGLAVVLSPVARWFLQAAKISKPQEEQAEEKEEKEENPKTNKGKKRKTKEEE